MAGTIANNFRLIMANGTHNFSSDTFKAIAMQYGFMFNVSSHDLYSDVAAYELSTGNGYTAGGVTLTGVAITQNDVDNKTDVTWNNITWTASGGDVGPIGGIILIDDTLTNDPIMGYIDFGGSYSVAAGGTATIANVKFRV